ncbi:MAG: DUF6443 domain-containing protein, partial [Cyclobacteriaceae bacterium]|nr:DUF6443 domain-containing protein [Cyclobacteriaceae bacterium]
MNIYKNITYQNLRLIFILLGFTFIILNKAQAQTSVVVGQQYYYTFSSYGNPDWWYIEAQNGTVVNQGLSGGVPFAYVVWSCAGPGFVRYVEYHETNGESSVQTNVSVSCPSISAPSTSFTYTQNCRSTTITRTSNPPAGQTWYWQISPTGTETSYGSAATFAAGANTQYYLRALVSGCCWGPAIATATVSIINPGLPTAANVSICGSGAAPLSASPGTQANLIRWYSYSNVFITESANHNPTISSTTNYYVRSYNSTVNCESSNKLVVATVNPLPAAPTAASSSPSAICGAGTVTLNASGAVGGESYRWYSTPSGGSALPNNTPSVSSTTTYYAAKRIVATGCEGSRTAGTVQVNPIPAIYTLSGNYCGAGTVTLNGSQSGLNYQLKKNGVNEGSVIAGTGAALSWIDKSAGIYTIEVYNSNGTCTTAMNGTVIVNALPGAPSTASASPSSLCGSASVTLSASGAVGGESYRWYTTASGGSALPNNTPSVSTTTTYYVAKRIDATGCEGPRTPVTISVNAIPTTFTINGGGTYCGSGTVTLSGSQTGVNYQLRKNGIDEGSVINGSGVGLSWPGKPTGTYTIVARNTNGSCATTMSSSAIINIDPATVAGTVGSSAEVYGTANGLLTLIGHTGSVLRWEKNEGSGWLTIANTTATNPYTNVSLTTQFRAVVKSGVCAEASSAPATLTLFPTPQINVNGSTYVTYGVSSQLATSAAFYSYQWKKDGVDISGATAQSLIVKEPGSYSVSVKGSVTAPAYQTTGVNIQSTLAAQPVNLVSVTRILKEGVNESTSLYSLQPEEVAQGISYLDGLGRMFQSVAVAQSPARTDIIQHQGYSKNGLQDTTFLPYVSGAGDGQLKLNAIRSSGSYTASEQYQFYQNTVKVATDAYPFARTLYRNTPDAKVIEQGTPGIDGQPGSTHTKRNVITFNNTNYPVRYWKVNGTTN